MLILLNSGWITYLFLKLHAKILQFFSSRLKVPEKHLKRISFSIKKSKNGLILPNKDKKELILQNR